MRTLRVARVRTARLLLRPFAASDVSRWHRKIFSDPEVMRYLPARAPVPRDRTAGLLRTFAEHWEQHEFGPWAMVDAESRELIGHCGLRFLPDSPEVELLYALEKARWGEGLTTEAAIASVRFGFEEAGLDHVVALAVAENDASRRVMEKAGLLYERDTFLFGLDLVRYSIPRERYVPGDERYTVEWA